MTIVKYPEWVEMQLEMLDETIEKIYSEHTKLSGKPDDIMRLKKNLYERIKPYVNEKVRLISNSSPTYIVDKER